MDHVSPTLIITLLLVKHFTADFLFQTNWMALNKGTFLHPGGLAHTGIHVLGSLLALLLASSWLPLGILAMLLVAEGILHYGIDYAKTNLDRKLGYSRLVYENGVLIGRLITSNKYYLLLGLDQLLHGLTYAAMLHVVLRQAALA